uniref:Putative lipocalin-5 1 n=1 Tax=Amblyomma triste TaxID=251400 RepID=A0A023GAD3_AMBTT
MAQLCAAMLYAVCCLLPALQLVSSQYDQDMNPEVPNAFRALEKFPDGVALYDIDKDGDLDCLTAERKEFSLEPPSATYVLSLRNVNGDIVRNITHHIKPGPTPDTTLYTEEGDDDDVHKCRFIYTDYKHCIVMEFPFWNGEECLMWISSEAGGGVPQSCTDKYRESCDNAVMAYDEESCLGLII